MENPINRIIFTASTSSRKNLSDKVENADTAKTAGSNTINTLNQNSAKYSVNDNDKIVVKMISNNTGKTVRTIPLSEQHAIDILT